ncbi:MAG: cupin domain-containing protein [Gammaproteobacteria bacterium]|nr:cupin domain-containing protein [Gammaproteobacteria bacterium]
MAKKLKNASVKQIAISVCAVVVVGLLVLGTQSSNISAQQTHFMGGSPEVRQAEEVRTIRILFPAGVRSDWHSHSWGQLLMVEEGRSLAQDRGGPVRLYEPGEPYWTPGGVEHWHGAHPDESALQLTIYEGTVDWGDQVTDEEYKGRL